MGEQRADPSRFFLSVNRRDFLRRLGTAGAVASLGLDPRVVSGEPPLETTRLRMPTYGGAICSAAQVVAEELLRSEGFSDLQYVRQRRLLLVEAGGGDVQHH